jgi:hypothetical protein
MKIGLLIPSTSKGRDWKTYKSSYLYINTIKTFIITYNKEHNYTFYIGIDRNDHIYDNESTKNDLIKLCSVMKNISIEFIYMDGINKGHLTVMWNRLFKKAYNDNCDYFFQCGDDIEFKTKNWVNDSISTLIESNNFGLTGPINNNPRILTQSFVSRKHMDLFGYYFPEEIINWFCDDWINLLYKKINKIFPLHNHLCVNVGGKPRYMPNNDLTFGINFDENMSKTRKYCIELVERDIEKIKNINFMSNNINDNDSITNNNIVYGIPESFCTICTTSCAFELVGLLLSLSIYHTNSKIYIICDTKTKSIINNITPQPKLEIIWFIELDIYDGLNRQSMEQKGIWSDFQMSKANIIKYALNIHNNTLYLDSDIIITDTINNIDYTKQLGVSPQFIKKEYIDKTGYYNGGMLWVNDSNIPNDWITYTKTSRYFDQASIENLIEKYSFFEFEENYNLQCWRLYLSDDTQNKIASYITSKPNDKLYYKNKPLKFIHTHFLDSRFKVFNNLLINHFKNAKMYKILTIIYRVINDKWILQIPKQPLSGLGNHTNDSYRELATLIIKNNNDVSIKYEEKSIHCWLEPNILLYDRPTLEWCNQEITNCSLMLLGNGDINIEGKILKNKIPNFNIKPWNFWARKPILIENILNNNEILTYNERTINSIFIGNFENTIQEKYRNNTYSWNEVISEYHCTKGKTHKFTHENYLMKLRNSKYGLCLRGYGSKCHREVELMAFGTVPIITPEVSIKSYIEPLQEDIHYIFVNNPDELNNKLKNITQKQWEKMSNMCFNWYQNNVHSKNCWNTTINYILYDI